MSLYADQPARRVRQVSADLLTVAWVVLWLLLARLVHGVVSQVAAPGRTLEDAGTSLESSLSGAGDRISEIPLVGDGLRAPFDTAGDAAGSITQAGVDLQEAVAQAALLAAVGVAFWPVLLAVVLWWRHRAGFARRSAAARQVLATDAGVDLFALRALARQPLGTLAALDGAAEGWRAGDPATVRALAALEASSAGVRLPDSPEPGGLRRPR